jgi:elongation factor P
MNDVVLGEYFNEEIIGIKISPKVELKVKESPDAVKGNTSSGATKKIILENGLEIFAPLFIKEGDIISINTENCEYSERRKN